MNRKPESQQRFEFALMMLDVLSHLPEAKICVAYELDGKRIEHFPCHADDLRRAKPIYETMPGWNAPTTEARKLEDLPKNARAYLDRIEELTNAPVRWVSVGTKRSQIIEV